MYYLLVLLLIFASPEFHRTNAKRIVVTSGTSNFFCQDCMKIPDLLVALEIAFKQEENTTLELPDPLYYINETVIKDFRRMIQLALFYFLILCLEREQPLP